MGDYTPPRQVINNLPAQRPHYNCFSRPPLPPIAPRNFVPPFFMSQHKYNPRQMLFVKNIPQDSAPRIVALFAPYKPLETKNLYPDSRITTFMVALPNAGATEEALRHTDGLRVGSSVISVERYNARQSTAARRDARKKRYTRGGQRGYDYDYDEGEYEGYEADEETQEKEMPTIEENVVPRFMNPPVAQTRKVSIDSGVSWANVASGNLAVQPSPSPAPAVEAHVERLSSASTPSFAPQGGAWDTRPYDHDTIGDDHHAPVWDDKLVSPIATPIRPPPGFQMSLKPPPGFEHLTPQSSHRPTPASLRPPPGFSQLPNSTPPGAHYYSAPDDPATTQAMQGSSSDSSRVGVDSSQHSHVPNVAQQQRGILAMDWNTTRSNQVQHCKDCVFCQMREASRLRQETEWQDMTRTEGEFKRPRMM